MNSKCSTSEEEDIYRDSTAFLIENIVPDYIYIYAYSDNAVMVDNTHNYCMYKNEVIEVLRTPKFVLNINYLKQKLLVIILPENTKCIIYLNENNKLCFVVK